MRASSATRTAAWRRSTRHIQELSDPERRQRHRQAAARAARAGQAWEWAGATAAGGAPAGSDHRSGRVPQPRTGRPVTARIDTSALLRPRKLDPASARPEPAAGASAASPLGGGSGAAARIHASGPTHRRPGPDLEGELPALADALDTRLKFGKFEGLTLADVAELEPTYVDWIVRTIDRDAGLVMAARVVLRYLERSGTLRRRRLDTAFPRR